MTCDWLPISSAAELCVIDVKRTGDTSGTPRATSSSALPIVLILVGVGALAAILFLVILKSSYDITGTWTRTYFWSGSSLPHTHDIIFTGTKTSGTLAYATDPTLVRGNYTADGKNVTWTEDDYKVFSGTFSDSSTMSGTITSNGGSGTWSAVKK